MAKASMVALHDLALASEVAEATVKMFHAAVRADITVRTLADAVGVSAPTLRKWAANVTTPPDNLALDTTLAIIVCVREGALPAPPRITSAIIRIARTSEELRRSNTRLVGTVFGQG